MFELLKQSKQIDVSLADFYHKGTLPDCREANVRAQCLHPEFRAGAHIDPKPVEPGLS